MLLRRRGNIVILKNRRKLELIAGLAGPVAALLMPIRFISYIGLDNFFASQISELVQFFGLPLAFSTFLAASAIGDYRMKHWAMLLLICLFGLPIISACGYFGFFFLIWGGLLNGLLMFAPAILAIFTMIFAVAWRIEAEDPLKVLP